MTRTCPCCGQPVNAGGIPAKGLEHTFQFACLQQSIVRVLSDQYPFGIHMDRLVERVYNGREPENAEGSIRVTITKLRKLLPEYGWTIPNTASGRGYNSTYKLEPVE